MNQCNFDDPSVYLLEMTEEFIDQNKDLVNWNYISANQTLSEPFIEKYADRVNWNYISDHQTLSEPFIEKYADRVNWELIFLYKNIFFIEKRGFRLLSAQVVA